MGNKMNKKYKLVSEAIVITESKEELQKFEVNLKKKKNLDPSIIPLGLKKAASNDKIFSKVLSVVKKSGKDKIIKELIPMAQRMSPLAKKNKDLAKAIAATAVALSLKDNTNPKSELLKLQGEISKASTIGKALYLLMLKILVKFGIYAFAALSIAGGLAAPPILIISLPILVFLIIVRIALKQVVVTV